MCGLTSSDEFPNGTGYTLRELAPHPNPAKAADGKNLRGLTPDPQTALVVRRIFDEFLAGYGLFAIAEGLTANHVPCPSARPRTESTPQRHRLVQERHTRHPHQPPLHRPAGMEQTTHRRSPPRRR
ncbi:recombinase family protein [Micromonospora sp. NBC_00858]|uniref:recombinase family protein n=1 Tax=Micromonospora sp. NBC_00858 TaxID=2975979 RepID=UPI0038686509